MQKKYQEVLSPNVYNQQGAIDYDLTRSADLSIVWLLLQHLGRLNIQTAQILEIGSGTGNYTRALFDKGVHIQGLDISSSMLKNAHLKSPHITWNQGDMRQMPFKDQSFEGIVTVNTLHYVRKSLDQTLNEVHRLLKPTGVFVIFTYTLEQCLQFWLGHYFPFFWELGHKICMKKEEIYAALAQHGFNQIEISTHKVNPIDEPVDICTYACKYRPHLFLDPKIRMGTSPLQIPEYHQEIEEGCKKLSKDIETGKIWEVIGQYEHDLGEGVVISAMRL